MSYYISADSFGADIPENYGQIADFLNQLIDERGIEEDHDACNELWDAFFSGELDELWENYKGGCK